MFFTYAHYTPEGRLFYIGKGSSVRRAHQMLGRNNYWCKVVAKYGKPEVKILAEWDTEQEAFEHEIALIKEYREQGLELCNLTDGGEGTSGYKHSAEHIQKNSLARLGKSAWWNIGRKHTEETKVKCGLANKGKPTSTKQKATASILFKGNTYGAGNTNNRAWIWVGTQVETKEVVRIIGEKAMKEAGFQHANIIKCINGQRKSHKGYTWAKESWGNA